MELNNDLSIIKVEKEILKEELKLYNYKNDELNSYITNINLKIFDETEIRKTIEEKYITLENKLSEYNITINKLKTDNILLEQNICNVKSKNNKYLMDLNI